jgi:hypothetical protein
LRDAAMAMVPFVLWALMLKRPDVGAERCPPAGEGQLWCQLQQSWIAWLTVVMLAGVATHAVVWVLAVGVPGVRRRLQRGERLRFGTPPSRRAWAADGDLAAAVWAPATQPGQRASALAERALARAQRQTEGVTDRLAVCGRCHRSQAIHGWRAVCPHCGGVALRAIVAPRVAARATPGAVVPAGREQLRPAGSVRSPA